MKIILPDNLDFSALCLARDSSSGGQMAFDWRPVEVICEANGIDIDMFRDSEDNLSGLLTQWYVAHRDQSGAFDPVMEDLIAETRLEHSLGAGLSHKAGRA